MDCDVIPDGMDYQGVVIRPPSEADSILLQATLGCSHNKCTFCGTYKDKRFTIKDEATILADLRFAQKYCRRQERLFIMDGDALVMPHARLVWLLEKIKEYLPWVTRVGLYANAKSVRLKTDEQLRQYVDLGVGIAYYGVETGHRDLLKQIKKGSTPETLITQGRRIKDAGMKLSVTVLLGIGGRALSLEHARATGELLTAMDPEYVGALTLMVLENTELGQDYLAGRFEMPTQSELLQEFGEMLAATDLSPGHMFFSNHASNYLPLKVVYPDGKPRALAMIERALSGRVELRPEWMRAL
jgi:radical SAM superfamily enzyme YgiQ (UPF0313 family)